LSYRVGVVDNIIRPRLYSTDISLINEES